MLLTFEIEVSFNFSINSPCSLSTTTSTFLTFLKLKFISETIFFIDQESKLRLNFLPGFNLEKIKQPNHKIMPIIKQEIAEYKNCQIRKFL
ncbi:hypothetical protein [Mesomycoplasma hyopneumoniae]|uniref:Uncharacterized protein n=1 Tax=Mesomycoplasma hyopneumoniae (strain J / ATCC 25934 / NCTC 10110) TaxID=262719 RepID=Q4A9G4_MESHJ|nr:hypothetical protein [Mesomycoplasma hyopneumoniae]AAZ44607.2 hypothetical protein MHJ_0693 [Mesomycoplasma hyopneumoniae J]